MGEIKRIFVEQIIGYAFAAGRRLSACVQEDPHALSDLRQAVNREGSRRRHRVCASEILFYPRDAREGREEHPWVYLYESVE